jgi:hypothetical protein
MTSSASITSSLALWPAAFLLVGGLGKFFARRTEAGTTAIGELAPGWVPADALSVILAVLELGIGGLVIAGLLLPWPEAGATLLLASMAVLAAVAIRRKPNADCGCLGRVARGPLSWRTIVRAGALSVMALAGALGGQPWTAAFEQPASAVVVLAVGIALVVGSPEFRAWRPRPRAGRRGVPDCATASIPVSDTLAQLRRDTLWGRALPYLRGPDVVDHWRDACWRFMCFPASYEDTPATAIFAIYLGEESSANVVAFVADENNATLGQLSAADR